MADACVMPYADQSFDAVITTDTFYFWRDPARTIQEISRVLASDGIFVNTYNKLYAAFVGKGTNEFHVCKERELFLYANEAGLNETYNSKESLFERQIVFRKEDVENSSAKCF